MPTDENGNRADVIIYGGSTIKRMNTGRLYEQFTNAASRDLLHRLRKEVGLQPQLTPTSHQIKEVVSNPKHVELIWTKLLGYYKIVSPIQYDLLKDDPDPARHVKAVLERGIYLYIPPDNPVDSLEMANTLKDSEYCPHYGPVTYKDSQGREVTTQNSVLIGSLYMLMLEKTGEDWSGVASVKTNHFGVAAKLNNFDRNTSPGRQQSVRALGESETRSYICTVGPEATMEILDQSNNPESHRVATETILKAPKPTAISKVVDRNVVPFGGARPVGFVEHLLGCLGMKFNYRPDDPTTEEPK